MKNTILILISLLFLTGCEKEVSEIQDRGGVKYEINSETPYTGKVSLNHKNGQKEYKGNFKDGKEDGIHISWHSNGQKKREGNFKDGKEEGLHISWHSNGQKMSEGNFKDGKEDGIHTEWYGNGLKEMEWNYKDGKEDGTRTKWNENGQKVSEKIYKDGVLVFKERMVVKDDNSDLTSYAHIHCNTFIQEKYGSDHTISMPQKPLNVWDIGDDDYVVNGETNVSDNGASIAQRYVCRIKFDDGDPNNIYNWSLLDISGLADLDEALRRRTLYSVE